MGIGDRGWSDRSENYADGYTISVNGTTATAIIASAGDVLSPAVLYSITVSVNPAVGSGEVALLDTSATGDATGQKYRVRIASAASQVFHNTDSFPRGLVFEKGIVVSALTVSGAISLTYKARYS